MRQVIVGVDLGGTKILAGLLTADGQILKTIKQPTHSEDGAEIIMDRISTMIRDLLALVPSSDQIEGIAVGAPGPLYYPEGIISTTPNLGWSNLDLKKGLSNRLQQDILVDNDANMAALAEVRYGQKDRYRNLLYLTVSTGIGGAAIINGEVYRGRDGGAGEFGHMVIDPRGPQCGCGRIGCFEAVASGTALARAAAHLIQQGKGLGIKEKSADPNYPTAEEVNTAAQAGDPEAQVLISKLIEYLGIGLSNLIHIFNPEIVILGGGAALGMGSLLLRPLTDYINLHTFSLHSRHLPIALSNLGPNAGLLGCAITVKDFTRGKRDG